MKIIMLLSNGFAPDPRVAAEAVALREAGHQVTIFAWDRVGRYRPTEQYHGVEIVRSLIKTEYSKGPIQILKFREFWNAAGNFLRQNSPDVVHCHDLDTLNVGLKYKQKAKIPVVFDAHEAYPDMIEPFFPGPLIKIVRQMEAKQVPQADVVITVGQLLAKRFTDLKARKVVVIGNYKNLPPNGPVNPDPLPPLTVIYVGGLNPDRLLAPLVNTIADDFRFQLWVVGDGPEKSKLKIKAGQSNNINFYGYQPQERAIELINQAHLVYYVVDPEYPNNRYSTPNLLFLAMAAGRPVITTSVGEIARIVSDWDCGTIVPDLNPETLRAVLSNYFDFNLWQRQSNASFGAALSEYNWELAAAKLVEVYRELER